MNVDEFRSVARLLASVDLQTMVQTGAIGAGDLPRWNAFRADPLRFLLKADEATAHCIWEAMMRCRERIQAPIDIPAKDIKVVELRTAAR